MKVNLSDVSDTGFDILPQGTYKLLLNSWEEKRSQSGKDFVNCEFIVNGGEFDGRKIWDKFFFTDGALWRLKQFSRAIDFPSTENPEGFDTDELFKLAKSVEVRAELIVDEYEDKKSGTKKQNNKVDKYMHVDGAVDSDSDVPF